MDDLTDGCPNWRAVDELRATKRNWFLTDQETAQYVAGTSAGDAYQEETIPAHPAFRRKDILYWDIIPLWKLQDRFTPQQRIYNSQVEALPANDISSRRQRMDHYLKSGEPKWVGNVVQILDDPDGWGDDQFPPAPKKLKVVQESSDDSNLGS
jgi:hypothetical protein